MLHHTPTFPGTDLEYEVEAIVGERNENGSTQYLVKWLGYDEDENTWEPYDHVADTKALDEWENRHLHHALTTRTIDTEEPQTFEEAITGSEAFLWKLAITVEVFMFWRSTLPIYSERTMYVNSNTLAHANL